MNFVFFIYKIVWILGVLFYDEKGSFLATLYPIIVSRCSRRKWSRKKGRKFQSSNRFIKTAQTVRYLVADSRVRLSSVLKILVRTARTFHYKIP